METKQVIEAQASKSPLLCDRCEGSGKSSYDSRPCYACNGSGKFQPVEIQTIMANIKGRKGLRSARPKDGRSYYVWRMARFHGGEDVTMPVCASMEVCGDPFIPILDVLADAVAKRVFGTDKAAAYRWMGAMGHEVSPPENMPASAFSCGPVVLDGDKPEEELVELM